MHILKTHTCPTAQADTFLVYWTNSLARLGGLIRVHVTAQIEDRHIAAELSAMQHLLEVKGVLGDKPIGNVETQLVVSLGAIRKLHRSQSDKTHLAAYANFLTTRFAGCRLSVDKDSRWFEGIVPESVDELLVSGPRRETINVAGLGEVAVTQHVLERIADRLLPDTSPDRTAQTAWKKLIELASDPSVREVSRRSLWAGALHCQNDRQEGRYFMNPKKKLVLVVTDNLREGRRLVTAYPATRQFQDIKIAA